MIIDKAATQRSSQAARRSRGRADGRRSAEAMRANEPKQARAHATRERLLDAFAELLYERPYAEISVADIAAAADVTTGAVYSSRMRCALISSLR